MTVIHRHVVERITLAPMVRGSELAFRSFLNELYGPLICYTPMLRADALVASASADGEETTIHEDARLFHQDCCATEKERLVVQLSGNMPSTLANACRLILERNSNICGIDLNLGCPQSCARDGTFGAFLHHDTAVKCIQQMRLAMGQTTAVLSAKIRLQPTLEETVAFALSLQRAGCNALAVHCRQREAKFDGPANLEAAKALVEALDIPVYVNGAAIEHWDDAQAILDQTGAAKLMIARPLLANPDMFGLPSTASNTDSKRHMDQHATRLAARYLVFALRHPPPTAEYIRLHLKWFYRRILQPTTTPDFHNWRHRLWNFLQRPYLKCVEQFQAIVVIFCSSAEIPVPETLQMIETPTFNSIRHMKSSDKKRKRDLEV